MPRYEIDCMFETAGKVSIIADSKEEAVKNAKSYIAGEVGKSTPSIDCIVDSEARLVDVFANTVMEVV